MPRLVHQVPRYRKHKASGQAIVKLSGQVFYLGPYGTKASKEAYDRAVAEWFARGRCPLVQDAGETGELTIVELIVRYKRHAESYYVKDDEQTSEVASILAAARFVKQLYGRESVAEFGPLKLQAVQHAMITAGLARTTINKQGHRIVRMFKWGVSQQLVPAAVHHALTSVPGLREGRTAARETEDVQPVADATVELTLPHLPTVVADMVRLQRLTGSRPGEICQLRPCDVDTSSPVWEYRP